MLLSLKVQVVLQVLMQGPMLVLLEVCETQAGIQAVHLEAPFASAQPLPPSMNAFCVQNVIRSQEEPRSQEPVQALDMSSSFPEDQWWIRCCESGEVLEEVVLLDEVCLEQGPVSGPRGVEVMAQGLRSSSSTVRV